MDPVATLLKKLGPGFRTYTLDQALLFFNRDQGTNVLVRGEETKEFRQTVPRVLQFGLSNTCNLSCSFCSREADAANLWTADTAFDFLAEMSQRGLMEVAFGGGEPLLFKDFVPLVHRLYDETALGIGFTSNGTWLHRHRDLPSIARKVGQCRLSIYDNNNWRAAIAFLHQHAFNVGLNYLVTPERLPLLPKLWEEWANLGIRDILLLNYKGDDRTMILNADELLRLEDSIQTSTQTYRGLQIKLDICFGHDLARIPRLHQRKDCDAGKDFLVITSDRKIQPCSFHQEAIPFHDADDAIAIWRQDQRLLQAANCLGCSRQNFKGA